MRTIDYKEIVNAVADLCMKSNYNLPSEVYEKFNDAIKNEESPLGKSILEQCVINAKLAADEELPICQDTGIAVFFIKIGSDLKINGGELTEAINEGVALGYKNGYLRKSLLSDPIFDRKNTGDNTPAIIHLEIVKGDTLEITIAPKGGGAENMSALKMFPPSAGVNGVEKFIVDTVISAGGNPCPPVVVGVGIGGNFERVAYLAKKALLRPLDGSNPDSRYAKLENEILEKINNSGVGPQGLGGRTTAFKVNIEFEPCHLASLPVAVNINCHVHRHKTIIL